METKSIPIRRPISPVRSGRKIYVPEKFLISYFEEALEVKITRKEMWKSIHFVCSLCVLFISCVSNSFLFVAISALYVVIAYKTVKSVTDKITGAERKGGAE